MNDAMYEPGDDEGRMVPVPRRRRTGVIAEREAERQVDVGQLLEKFDHDVELTVTQIERQLGRLEYVSGLVWGLKHGRTKHGGPYVKITIDCGGEKGDSGDENYVDVYAFLNPREAGPDQDEVSLGGIEGGEIVTLAVSWNAVTPEKRKWRILEAVVRKDTLD